MSAGYPLLKICVLILPELDAPLSMERPSFDGLEALLVHDTSETMAIELGGSIGPFSRGVSPRFLCGKLFRSHFLRGQTLRQSYSVRALGRRLQVDWARDPRKGPRVLMSLRVDFEPMG